MFLPACNAQEEIKTVFKNGFPGGAGVKNPPANAGDVRDADLIPGSERSPGGGNGNPIQYSCLENSMDRGTWGATVHEIAKNRTQLSTHTASTKE